MLHVENENSIFVVLYSCQEHRNTFLDWESAYGKTSITLRLRVPVLFKTVKGMGGREREKLFQTEGGTQEGKRHQYDVW